MVIYFSDREIPLIYNGSNHTGPVLTVENHFKWYDLWLVQKDGSVARAEYDTYRHLDRNDHNETLWGDHVVNPKFFRVIAEIFGAEPDHTSYQLVLGRWIDQHMGERF